MPRPTSVHRATHVSARRKLARPDRRPLVTAIFQQLPKVAAVRSNQRTDSPVAENQQVVAQESRLHTGVGSVGTRHREFLQLPRHTPVQHSVSLTTCLLAECPAHKRLDGSHWTAHQHQQMLLDVLSRLKLRELGYIYPAQFQRTFSLPCMPDVQAHRAEVATSADTTRNGHIQHAPNQVNPCIAVRNEPAW